MLKSQIEKIINSGIVKLNFHNPHNKNQPLSKIVVVPVLIKDTLMYQFQRFENDKVFHNNCSKIDCENEIIEILNKDFKQISGQTEDYTFELKISKKGKPLFSKKMNKSEIKTLSHNKEKEYLLLNGEVIPPLVDLGVMNTEGRIIKGQHSKFVQINKFIEQINQSLNDTEIENFHIVDFGCGKSYLSFLVYYYFTEIKKKNITMTGLDLKEDVIEDCNKISKKYGYDGLNFLVGDIKDYDNNQKIDMVITLHACDIATDYAIFYAIEKNAKWIFSVPCCQTEINKQITKNTFAPLSGYGLLKEKFSALFTDGIRASLIESMGYKVDILEFVDESNSPKNNLLRCKKSTDKIDFKKFNEVEKTLHQFNLKQTLFNLLDTKYRQEKADN